MSTNAQTASPTADREIVTTRLFDAPRALVFEAWTNEKHLAHWWGPDGFTTTTYEMNFAPGGSWRFMMHGPDGRDYPNKINYLEIVPNERLYYAHTGDDGIAHFHTTVTFTDEAGQTRLTMTAVFPTKEMRDMVVRDYGAVEGGQQTISHLNDYVRELERERGEFTVTRVFNAPRQLLFDVWTQPEHLVRWWGHRGYTLPVCEVDLREGGRYRFCMRTADGTEYWVAGEYTVLDPPSRLVFTNALTNVTPTHDAIWSVGFEQADGQTRMTFHLKLIDISQARDGAREGFGTVMERFAEEVTRAQQGRS